MIFKIVYRFVCLKRFFQNSQQFQNSPNKALKTQALRNHMQPFLHFFRVFLCKAANCSRRRRSLAAKYFSAVIQRLCNSIYAIRNFSSFDYIFRGVPSFVLFFLFIRQTFFFFHSQTILIPFLFTKWD